MGDHGRYIMMVITFNNKQITLLNVYAWNNDNPDFIIKFIDILENSENEDIILGGDFNCVLDDHKIKKEDLLATSIVIWRRKNKCWLYT